jgi:hypothetical protein
MSGPVMDNGATLGSGGRIAQVDHEREGEGDRRLGSFGYGGLRTRTRRADAHRIGHGSPQPACGPDPGCGAD